MYIKLIYVIYMSFKLCIYAFWAHGGEFFDMNTVTKGTLFAILQAWLN